LPGASRVELGVFNARGELVRTLARGDHPAGKQRVSWDGRDNAGREVGSGVYFIRLRTDGGCASEKVVKLR
jgi:flagellar hook assembly protein FlgD